MSQVEDPKILKEYRPQFFYLTESGGEALTWLLFIC